MICRPSYGAIYTGCETSDTNLKHFPARLIAQSQLGSKVYLSKNEKK